MHRDILGRCIYEKILILSLTLVMMTTSVMSVMAKSTGFYDGQNFTVTGSYFKGQEVHTYTRNYTFRVLTIDETLDIYTQDWNMPKFHQWLKP